MAFITKEDLYTQILIDELDEITRNDDTLITQAISAAISEMKTYLYDSYDTDKIFTALGDGRHALLINYASDMTIWYLSARCQAGIDLEDRKARYDRAIKWLRMVNKQENYPDLPFRETTVQTHIKFGSNPKRKNYY